MLLQRIRVALLAGLIHLTLIVTAFAYSGISSSYSNQLPKSIQTEWIRKAGSSATTGVFLKQFSNKLTQILQIGAVHVSLTQVWYDQFIHNTIDQHFKPEHSLINPFLRSSNRPRSSTADLGV